MSLASLLVDRLRADRVGLAALRLLPPERAHRGALALLRRFPPYFSGITNGDELRILQFFYPSGVCASRYFSIPDDSNPDFFHCVLLL